MDFQLSEEQKLFVQSVKSFVSKELPISRSRKLRDDEIGYSPEVWKQMGELGWLALSFPESVGGFGADFADTGLIIEQLGTTLVSEPFIASVVLAGNTLLLAGTEKQQQRWLAPMITGDSTLALAYAEHDSRYEFNHVRTEANKDDSVWHLKGEKSFVLNGHAADHIIVSARVNGAADDARGLSLFVVDKEMPGVKVQPIVTMDGRKAAMISLDCKLGEDRLLGVGGQAGAVLAEVLDLGAAAVCAEGCGIMQTLLKMTVEYLQTREQFGVKIGAFQALQHRAVDMFTQTELAKSTALAALIKASETDSLERQRAISAAKVQLALSGRYVTQQAIQLHGGIGITDEHDVGLYFKRMHILNALFGDEQHHVTRFGSLPTFARGIERRAG